MDSIADQFCLGYRWFGLFTRVVAIALGVTSANARARHLYERLGFAAVGVSMVRWVAPPLESRPATAP
jgi:hypothetical protein